MGTNVRQNIVTNGLVLYLDAGNRMSYPGSGTTWRDLSGNGNNGTLTNGPTFSGADQGSIVFDGVDDYVNCGNGASLNITNQVTLTCCFRLNSPPSVVGNPSLIDKWDWPNNLRVYTLGTEGGVIAAYVSRDGTFNNRLVILDNQSPIVGQNYFLCMRYDGQTLTLIKNNTLVGTASYSIPYSLFSSQPTETWVGRSRDAGQGGRWISANIFQVQIYNRALSPQEILQNYNATKTRFGLT